MAALAIPIVILGSLYILSEQEKKNDDSLNDIEDNFHKKEFFNSNKNNMKKEGFSNYNTINNYNSNSNTNTNTNNNASVNSNNINLLNGNQIDSTSFRHNNMQPYFGAKIRGNTNDLNNSESILDSKQGNGSQIFSKSEQAPLFRPEENTNLPNGTQNNSDFFQSRMNESMKMSNVTLWEPERVGPGLNLGYNNSNGSDGFNSGMMSRDSWMPKSVNDLRVENNPKQSFDLLGHEGPLLSSIKNQGSIGKVEKHLPDKVFDNDPHRWFTTTGIEKNPPIRSTQVIPMENRIDTTREYYGSSGNSQGQATYSNNEYEESKKINLGQLPLSNATATGQNKANPNDYNVKSYNILPNNRTTDGNHDVGGIFGVAKAALTPILDILKPTRKENAIGNIRQTGNVNGLNPSSYIANLNDKTKVTNRQMTTNKIDMNFVNVQGQNHRGDGYQVTQYQPVQNQRDSTNKEYIGGGTASGVGLRPYNAAYAQENNVNKTYESRTNQGNMSLFNNDNNVEIHRNENILQQNRGHIMNGGPNVIPSSDFMGEMNGIQTYDLTYNNSRMDESLLSAFKNNPYTQSLNSVA